MILNVQNLRRLNNGAEEGTPNNDNLIDLRADLAEVIKKAQKAQETMVAPGVQEHILAIRHQKRRSYAFWCSTRLCKR